ncbi:MAG: bacitracin ABC transporter ATP-binding protein, partial [Lactobacillus sp.]|nr:bacitracin ABC transporter ATP-binding protein [Lactobacillus sp.]
TMADLNQNDGITTLMVTHDPFAASFASRILFIKDGQIGEQMLKNGQSRQEFYHLLIDHLDTAE